MIFPIGTDEPIRRVAWCTYAIMAVTLLSFLLVHEPVMMAPDVFVDSTTGAVAVANPMAQQLQPPTWMPLKSPGFVWYQLFTYQFAEISVTQLAVNMIFLFALGRALENKLGHVRFLGLYLIGGAVAGVGHILTSSAPVVGAAGSVCAVTGVFLALLPNANVRVVYFFFVSMGVLDVTGVILVLAYFCLDLFTTVFSIRQSQGAFSVAYTAHLVGYLFGAGAGLLLLRFKFIASSHNDLLFMISQYRRRQEFRQQIRSGSQPWMNPRSAADVTLGTGPTTPEKEHLIQLRAQANKKALAQDFEGACEVYLQILALDATQTLTRQTQHDVANHFFSTQRHAQAAAAYERFLDTYKADPDRNQVQLMLTVLYVRYLGEPEKARASLAELEPQLRLEEHKALARALREEMGEGGGTGKSI